MRLKALCSIISVSFGLALAAGTANAKPITWHLEGVTFSNGGTATGSFDFDADTNTYSAIDITTTGPLAFTVTDMLGYTKFGFDAYTGSTAAGSGFLQLIAVSNFTDAGGVLPLGTNYYVPYEATYDGIGFGLNDNFSDIVSGEVVAAPEPLTLSLFGASLAGAAAAMRRRRKANKAA